MDKRSSPLPLARKRARRTKARPRLLMHFAALFMIHFHPEVVYFQFSDIRLIFVSMAPRRRRSPTSCTAMKFIAPRISRTSPRAMVNGYRDRGKSDISGDVLDGIFKSVRLTSYLYVAETYTNSQRETRYVSSAK